METKEKVIEALQRCADPDAPCDDCAYRNNDPKCMSALMLDAAILLSRSSEPVVKNREAGEDEG